MSQKDFLRLKAEELLRSNGVSDKTLYEKDLESLIEELSIHQFELEHQNQALKEAYETLNESQKRFSDLFNNAPVGYLLLDKNYIILEINYTACRILGESSSELIHTSITKLTHPDSQDDFYFFFKSILKNSDYKSCEIKLRRGDGQYFYANLIAVSDQGFSQYKTAARIAMVDVTVQKELELKLLLESEKSRESDRLKSAFLANMSHEIRTPLNGILGFASLIYDDDLDRETTKNYAEIINRNGERLLALINKILDISKIESGNMFVEKTTIVPEQILDEVIELYSIIALKKNLKLVKNIPSDGFVLEIETDKVKLEQILINLLSNAIKFTRQGQIELGYSLSDQKINFFVKDTGIGITQEGMDHLFERFYQVNSKSKYNSEGSGLGLSLCKALVELLGGKIWVKSIVDSGTSIFFDFPAECIGYRNEKQYSTNNNDELVSILIAEDDKRYAELFSAMLSKYDLDIVYAKDGLEAVEIIQKHPSLRMVFMDINMPLMNGLDVAKEIRRKNIKLPIVAVTAYTNEYKKTDALDIGFNDYIEKPLSRDKISKIFNKYVNT